MDKHVDEAKRAHHLVDQPLAVLFLAQIGRGGDGAVGGLVQHEHSEGIVGLLVLAGLDIGEGDGGAHLGEAIADDAADAIGAARGKSHLALEPVGGHVVGGGGLWGGFHGVIFPWLSLLLFGWEGWSVEAIDFTKDGLANAED